MADLTIHRGSHQIGGCCTEITCGGERILIDRDEREKGISIVE